MDCSVLRARAPACSETAPASPASTELDAPARTAPASGCSRSARAYRRVWRGRMAGSAAPICVPSCTASRRPPTWTDVEIPRTDVEVPRMRHQVPYALAWRVTRRFKLPSKQRFAMQKADHAPRDDSDPALFPAAVLASPRTMTTRVGRRFGGEGKGGIPAGRGPPSATAL